jgi:hypothetical protein
MSMWSRRPNAEGFRPRPDDLPRFQGETAGNRSEALNSRPEIADS